MRATFPAWYVVTASEPPSALIQDWKESEIASWIVSGAGGFATPHILPASRTIRAASEETTQASRLQEFGNQAIFSDDRRRPTRQWCCRERRRSRRRQGPRARVRVRDAVARARCRDDIAPRGELHAGPAEDAVRAGFAAEAYAVDAHA